MAFTTDLGVLTTLNDQQFYELCRSHPDVKFERTPGGYLVIMPPDVSWVRQERWDALSPDDRERFPPIAPDFVLELISPSDTLPEDGGVYRQRREARLVD